ncbi:MAG: helix-turn-helix transcriptional regulator [Sphaerochaeta sp.]|uniref:helix-turn-helix transcriptional regulator n=1 Tax=Sphaerochaeta sp. TaxID=1972642 RepID=UPI001DA497A3|nr:helix-turn-helix transcriptional regulator [uncultured Sphaerochaeta sp.]MDD3056695.1 helix-turn-helix transcriptional regulator [Sphaerochaeta sp.]MDD3928302.1 helix-turn-helix transcriptional regulator [Sphaerochaeta sp.]NCC90412.1 LuxR family transcriptional regulator [Spirochaetia bacterium]
MNGLHLLVYMLAFALGCMTLALAIVYRLANKQRWATYFIVCHASLLGCMMLLALQTMSKVFLSGLAYQIITYSIAAVVIGNLTFLIVFIPYFTTWVIAQPWRQPYKALFFGLAAAYLALGIAREVTNNLVLDQVMLLVFVFVVGFCLSVMLRNLNSIANKTARASAITIIIVSFAMVPAILVALFFPSVKSLLFGIYFLALSITIMVFLFMEFVRLGREGELKPKQLVLEDLEEYHITEREFAVIELISKGLTNKEMATQLGISANTVNNHVANIYSKTKVRSRIDLLNLLKQSW